MTRKVFKLPKGVNREASIKALKQAWGSKYEENLAKVDAVLTEFLSPEDQRLIGITKIAQRPSFLKGIEYRIRQAEETMQGVKPGDRIYNTQLAAMQMHLRERISRDLQEVKSEFVAEQRANGSFSWSDFGGDSPDVEVIEGDQVVASEENSLPSLDSGASLMNAGPAKGFGGEQSGRRIDPVTGGGMLNFDKSFPENK
jgi:hypothetical protein